jgi:hypothetical protein
VITEAYIQGVSTRSVDTIDKAIVTLHSDIHEFSTVHPNAG